MVGCLIFILVYVHRFLTLNREPWNREPKQLPVSLFHSHIYPFIIIPSHCPESMQSHSMAPKNMLFSLPVTDIYVHIYGHVGRRITVIMPLSFLFYRSDSFGKRCLGKI
jgi:hypothetical protein